MILLKNILKVVKVFFVTLVMFTALSNIILQEIQGYQYLIKKRRCKTLYTQKEIDLILNRFADNDTFTCVFLTSCYIGVRTGEVCALTWDNINFEKEIINIEHNVYDKLKNDKGKCFIRTTKTQTLKREQEKFI